MGPVDSGNGAGKPSSVGAIVVAGGAGRRMGGVDKLALHVGGSPLLDRVLCAVRPLCSRLIVAGPTRPTSVGNVRFVREDSPGGGPLPGILAGLAATADAELIFVLAADLPMITTSSLARLVAALEQDQSQAAAALDDRGAPNPLLAVYRCGVLHAAASRGLGHGGAAARLLPHALAVVDLGGHATLNVNRPRDLRQAQALLATGEGAVGQESPV